MRLSGVLLLFLAVGHMLLQHVFRDVHNLTLQVVRDIWQSWGWRVYDVFLLAFAITHGFNGFRQVIQDYISEEKTVKIANYILVVLVILTIIWSAVAIFSFNPDAIMASVN
jgi:succinate dehydrogenase / fumarate reductase membrane anchor subunit